MPPDAIWSAISGSMGALAVLSLWVYSLLRRYQLPWYFFDSSEKRNGFLEAENSSLNHSVIELARQNAELKAEMKALRDEVQYLRVEIQRARDGRK